MAIVEGFEVVNVDHQQGQRLGRALRTVPFLPQALVQDASVGQPGQGIGGGQFRQFLFGPIAAVQFVAQHPGQP